MLGPVFGSLTVLLWLAWLAARLQTWHHMVHVWDAFCATLPEATEAFVRIAEFLESVAPRTSGIAPTVEQAHSST